MQYNEFDAVPPVLWIPNQLEGTIVGREVKLMCQVEAYPIPIVYWTMEEGDILAGSKSTLATSLSFRQNHLFHQFHQIHQFHHCHPFIHFYTSRPYSNPKPRLLVNS